MRNRSKKVGSDIMKDKYFKIKTKKSCALKKAYVTA
jgi:hypothetical protein